MFNSLKNSTLLKIKEEVYDAEETFLKIYFDL
jgi:hypothetical protein